MDIRQQLSFPPIFDSPMKSNDPTIPKTHFYTRSVEINKVPVSPPPTIKEMYTRQSGMKAPECCSGCESPVFPGRFSLTVITDKDAV